MDTHAHTRQPFSNISQTAIMKMKKHCSLVPHRTGQESAGLNYSLWSSRLNLRENPSTGEKGQAAYGRAASCPQSVWAGLERGWLT